jgi:hypothetical protein
MCKDMVVQEMEVGGANKTTLHIFDGLSQNLTCGNQTTKLRSLQQEKKTPKLVGWLASCFLLNGYLIATNS